MTSLEIIDFRRLANFSKLLISGELCPRLRSLKVEEMQNLDEMDLKQLESLNTLDLQGCPKLETISGLSFLIGLQVFKADKCEGLKSLPTIAHNRLLERITILGCLQLQSAQGFEELQGLKSLVIEVPDNGYAWVRNCLYGLQRLPSEYSILTGTIVTTSSSILDEILLLERMETQSISEIEEDMRSSSRAIAVYALLGRPDKSPARMSVKCINPPRMRVQFICFASVGKQMSAINRECGKLSSFGINEGFKATMNEEEESEALSVVQRIVDRLYGESKRTETCNLF